MGQFSRDDTQVAQHLYKECLTSEWLEDSVCFNSSVLGVGIKGAGNNYTFEPTSIDSRVVSAIQKIGLPVAFTMSSEITSTVFTQIFPNQNDLLIQTRGIRIPVVESLKDIDARSFEIKQSLVCLVREENVVLLWSNNVEAAVPHGSDIEQMFMETVWGSSFGMPRVFSRPGLGTRVSSTSRLSSLHELSRPGTVANFQTLFGTQTTVSPQTLSGSGDPKTTSRVYAVDLNDEKEGKEDFVDPEAAKIKITKRPMVLTHSVMVGLTLIFLLVIEGVVIGRVVSEIKYDGKYTRLALLVVIPFYTGFAMASALVIVFNVFQIFAPIKDNLGNSRYYSAVAPNPAKFTEMELPHITIQIPVYTESLTNVIAPTVASVRAAIRQYESVGGTASIFVNDDGMQIIAPEVAEARRLYYTANHVGWCARPPHKHEGFVRKGRFKKASNMNYCLDFSNRVEDELLRLIAHREESSETQNMTIEVENELYEHALESVITSDEGRTMAAGNVRLGEIILLVDCDTRVPENCLHMGALEMLECPDIAIVQHTSGVLRVAHNFFEIGISYLTDLVYTAIGFQVGSGDTPCFVGHNAFLRWKAIQSVVFEEDGKKKFWSESHVSEDFHLSLRLQIAGFGIRLANYHGEGFKEGVSLTVFDEIARWEKYAYGTNELIFNVPWQWFYKGPITALYLRYFFCRRIKTSSKFMVLSYCFTYYAIAAGLPLCLLNYLLVGWWPTTLDQFYVTSWNVFPVILIIYNGITPIAYCIVRWRLGKQRLQDSALQCLMWTPLLLLFFGGISFHLAKAIIRHFLGLNMEWTATAKELETTGFFIGIDRVLKDFIYMYVSMILLTGGLIYLGLFAPYGWGITDWTALVPLAFSMVCHCLLPIALGIF